MIPKLHVLNFGGGVESCAILLRWILEPASRPFRSWSHLLIIMAQTGDETQRTKWLIETFIFPLLRSLGVRFVQLCKASPYKKDGYLILDDSTAPQTFYADITPLGGFPLSRYWKESGTNQRLGRPHCCAHRFKGEVLDAYLQYYFLCRELWLLLSAQLMGSDRHLLARKATLTFLVTAAQKPIFGPYLGYNAQETKRSAKADGYTCLGHNFIYPLQQWGWSREDCLAYLHQAFGVEWSKSACKACPFLHREEAIKRYADDPSAGAEALIIEHNTLAFNPRLHLFSSGTALDLITESGNQAALDLYHQFLKKTEWAIYQVRRIYRKVPTANGKPRIDADRWSKLMAHGTQADMTAHLAMLAAEHDRPVVELHGQRFYLRERPPGQYPALEEFFVVAPRLCRDEKVRSLKSFNQKWRELTNPVTVTQLNLFATAVG